MSKQSTGSFSSKPNYAPPATPSAKPSGNEDDVVLKKKLDNIEKYDSVSRRRKQNSKMGLDKV